MVAARSGLCYNSRKGKGVTPYARTPSGLSGAADGCRAVRGSLSGAAGAAAYHCADRASSGACGCISAPPQVSAECVCCAGGCRSCADRLCRVPGFAGRAHSCFSRRNAGDHRSRPAGCRGVRHRPARAALGGDYGRQAVSPAVLLAGNRTAIAGRRQDTRHGHTLCAGHARRL